MVMIAVHNCPYPFGTLGVPVMIIILVNLQGKDQERRELGRKNGFLSLFSAIYATGICVTIYLLSEGKWVFVLVGLIVAGIYFKIKKNLSKNGNSLFLMVWFTLQGGIWLLTDYLPVLSLDEIAGSVLVRRCMNLVFLMCIMMIALRLTIENHPAFPDFMARVRPVYTVMLLLLLAAAINSNSAGISFSLEDNWGETDKIEITLDDPEWTGEWYWTYIGEYIPYSEADTTPFHESSGSIKASGNFLHVIATDGMGGYVHRVYFYPVFYRDMGERDTGVVFDLEDIW